MLKKACHFIRAWLPQGTTKEHDVKPCFACLGAGNTSTPRKRVKLVVTKNHGQTGFLLTSLSVAFGYSCDEVLFTSISCLAMGSVAVFFTPCINLGFLNQPPKPSPDGVQYQMIRPSETWGQALQAHALSQNSSCAHHFPAVQMFLGNAPDSKLVRNLDSAKTGKAFRLGPLKFD
jgi:hypothetical protein